MKKSFFLLNIILSLLISCNNENDDLPVLSLSCDLETTHFYDFVASDESKLSGADYKSDDFSRSGNYSVRVENGHDKALEIEIDNVSIGDEIHVKVWRLKQKNPKSFLSLQIGEFFYYYQREVTRIEGDWELLEIDVVVSKEFPGEGMRVYVQNTDDQPAYFDDISISLKRNGGLTLKSHPELPLVLLEIDKEGLAKIEDKRLEAIDRGVLMKGKNDWVPVIAHWNKEVAPAKIRLKGDWIDHLYGQKFSFRVNVKGDKTLNTYSKFSLQNPVSRHYLDEWFVHQILMKKNVLTTRYEFVDLKINNQTKGMYAVEEHFTDNLLIAQNRKPGVILKYDEDKFWLSRYEHNGKEIKGVPWAAAAKIKTFSTKTVFADEIKTRDFFRGRDLLYQFHFKTRPVNEIIDLDKMAIFLALMDVTTGYHGMLWHNLRFYYNASSGLLEPVAYDMFSEEIHPPGNYDFLGQLYLKHPRGFSINKFDLLFVNPDFVAKYSYYLKEFTHPGFFKNEISRLDSLFSLYENEIRKEYSFYHFNMQRYKERAELIRNGLENFESGIAEILKNNPKPTYLKVPKSVDYLPIESVSLKANLVDSADGFILQLRGYYYQSLMVKAVISNADTTWLPEPVELPPYLVANAPEIFSVKLFVNPDVVLFQTTGVDSVFSQKVIKYRVPED